MDGRIMRCAIISSCQSAATSEIVKCSWACVDRGAALYQVPDLYLYHHTAVDPVSISASRLHSTCQHHVSAPLLILPFLIPIPVASTVSRAVDGEFVCTLYMCCDIPCDSAPADGTIRRGRVGHLSQRILWEERLHIRILRRGENILKISIVSWHQIHAYKSVYCLTCRKLHCTASSIFRL